MTGHSDNGTIESERWLTFRYRYFFTTVPFSYPFLERVLERGERIELLVDKTDNLNQQAFAFKKRSTALKVS